MDWNPQTLQLLSQSFLDSLSPQPELRRRAEQNLSDTADTPNYGLAVIRLVAEPWVDEQTRQCAAINFKNHVKTRWVASSGTPISDGEKEQIKTLMVPLMLSATQKIQAELSQALAVIGNHDFPESWPDLLPDLKSHLEKVLNADDFASANAILATLNSLFKRFRCDSSLYKRSRYESKRNMILFDLEYCSNNFAAPLLSSFVSISRKINTCGSVATLRQLLEAQRLCCRIFYSLNFLEKLEDKADEWMNEFKKCLTVSYPAIEGGGEADCVDELRASVCENLILYMEKKEEVFQKHVSDFVEAVCSLLVVLSASQRLTVSGIKYLSIVCKSSDELFGRDEILQSIVIPNLMLRDEDEALFKKDYMEFIRRDMEFGTNTRRRNAYELVKGIARNHKEKITEQIDKCLQLFAENPVANWKYKECAIHLVVSLSTIDLVDVESFFRSVIVPELQCEDVNKTFPMLKAAALNFFTVFRVLIPKHVAMPVVSDVVRFVRSNVRVVHSYAATCIEKLLVIKDNHDGVRYTSMDMGPVQERLIYNLHYTIDKARWIQNNHYIMRCLMRALETVSDLSRYPCMFYLDKALQGVCFNDFKSNKNPVFNHFLFEAVATVVRRVCENEIQPYLVRSVMDMFGLIVNLKIRELFPYAFQLLAQLVDLNRPPVPDKYMEMFDNFFFVGPPDLWDNSENVPVLVLTLQSYLKRAPNQVNTEGRLRHVVLGIISKLVSSPSTEEEGFRLLNTVIENYEYGVIAEYMNQIWGSLYNRLQNSKTPTFVRCLIVFMSLFLVKHGVQTLVDLIDSVEVNLFHVILDEFWIPNLKSVSTGYNYTEVKLIAVASTKLLYESAALLDPAAEELWGKLLDAIVTLLSLPLPPTAVDDDDDDDDYESDLVSSQGFKFVRLRNVGKKEDWDPLKEIEDPKQFLVGFPANLSSQFRGRFPLVIKGYLSPPNQAELFKLCNSYNIALV